MWLRFIAADEGSGSIVEAGVDDVTLVDCAVCGASAPAEVSGVRVTKAGGTVAELSWAFMFNVDSYDVYRGEARDASDLACFQTGITGTSTQDDGALPPAGGAFFHVVTARNCAGESPLGQSRTAATPCP